MSTPDRADGRVRPYGDTTGDGMVQVSFTLPVPHDKRAEGAALQLAAQDGPRPRDGGARQGDGPGLHVLRRLRRVTHLVDLGRRGGRRAGVPAAVGQGGQPGGPQPGCAASSSCSARASAPTRTPSGIDAILNVKGFAGEKGLEYYRELRVVNLGAQVLVPDLVARARAEQADAVLVSQVVTQRDAHLHNTRELSAAFAPTAVPAAAASAPLLVVGGPRFDAADDRRARRRPDLRPRHHPARGRELPRARPLAAPAA